MNRPWYDYFALAFIVSAALASIVAMWWGYRMRYVKDIEDAKAELHKILLFEKIFTMNEFKHRLLNSHADATFVRKFFPADGRLIRLIAKRFPDDADAVKGNYRDCFPFPVSEEYLRQAMQLHTDF